MVIKKVAKHNTLIISYQYFKNIYSYIYYVSLYQTETYVIWCSCIVSFDKDFFLIKVYQPSYLEKVPFAYGLLLNVIWCSNRGSLNVNPKKLEKLSAKLWIFSLKNNIFRLNNSDNDIVFYISPIMKYLIYVIDKN